MSISADSKSCLTRAFQDFFFLLFKLVIIAPAVFGSNPLEVNHVGFPGWAHGIGYAISATPILIIIGCAVYQMFQYKFDWVCICSRFQISSPWILLFLRKNYFNQTIATMITTDDIY